MAGVLAASRIPAPSLIVVFIHDADAPGPRRSDQGEQHEGSIVPSSPSLAARKVKPGGSATPYSQYHPAPRESAMRIGAARASVLRCLVVEAIALASLALAGCESGSPPTAPGPIPVWGFADPTAGGPGAVPCSELVASDFTWRIAGLTYEDIIDGALEPADVVALLDVGERISLWISTRSTKTTNDCAAKAESVQLLLSDPSVARVDVGGDRLRATLVGLRPGETALSGHVTFGDGSAPSEATLGVELWTGGLDIRWRQVRVVRVR